MIRKQRAVLIGSLILVVTTIAGACFAAYGENRFSGGSYDGYGSSVSANTTISSGQARGTTIFIR